MYKYQPPRLQDTGGIMDKRRNVVQFRQSIKGTRANPIGATVAPPDEPQYDDQGRKITVIRKSGHTIHGDIPLRAIDFPKDFTVFDLFFSQTPEAEEYRGYFQDWAIPEVRIGELEGRDNSCETRIMALRNIASGEVNTMAYRVRQYLYAVLNGIKSPVSTFGDPDGTSTSRTNYIVCAYVGDPFTHNLMDAYIEYALPLNRKLNDCVRQSGMHAANLEFVVNKLRDEGRMRDAEELKERGALKCEFVGIPELEEEIGVRWFNERDAVFNTIIHPIASRCIPPLT